MTRIDEGFSSIKDPVRIIGKEKKSDKKIGIKNKPNGIKILNDSSKVIAFTIQYKPKKKYPKPNEVPK